MKTIAEMKIGESAVVHSFTESDLSLKLMEMGLLPGEGFRLEQIAPLGDPFILQLSDYQLILRKKEASTVVIDRGE